MFGKYLSVDLTNRKIKEEKIPEKVYSLLLGGKGLALYLLFKHFANGDALTENNPLIFAGGPFTGLNIPGAGRLVAVSKSPLADFYAEAYAGGYFPHEFRRTGFDALVIRGKSISPLYLEIVDGNIELKDADSLWGKTTGEVADYFQEKYGSSVRFAIIGPAGENLVRFAAIMNDVTRAFGRGGLGAVMGSKFLKAIVVRGNHIPPVENKDAFKEARKRFLERMVKEAKMPQRFGKYGTSGGVSFLNTMNILPTKNFQLGRFDKYENITGEKMAETILVGRETCTSCPVRCKRVVETQFAGVRVSKRYGGPEYETLAAFGSLTLNDDLNSIALINQLCNMYGLDTISTGNVIAFTIEAIEKGLINTENPLHWGDAKAIVNVVKAIVYRKGLGDLMADGVKRMAQKLGNGASSFAMHVKGLEVPMHEPRGKVGLGLSYATSPRGATHMEGFHDTMVMRDNPSPHLLGEGYPKKSRISIEDKARLVYIFENARSFVNSLVMCAFTVAVTGKNYNLTEVQSMLNAISDVKRNLSDLLRIGERNYTLARLFAVKQGLQAKDDILPRRFMEEPLEYEEGKVAIKEELLKQMLAEYYKYRGYDSLGRPKTEKIKELQLNELDLSL